MSSIDINEITKINLAELEKAMEMMKNQPPQEETEELPLVTTKAIYDPETLFVISFTTEETDKPHIIVTQEQLDSGILFRPVKVIDGKIVEETPTVTPELPLTEGEKWKTSEANMLIIGNEKGWDERKNS